MSHADTLRDLSRADLEHLGELMVTAWTLATCMGHTSPGLTLETYCTVDPENRVAQLGRDMLVGCLAGRREESERVQSAIAETHLLDRIAERVAGTESA